MAQLKTMANSRLAVALIFAVGGAAVIGFVFVPELSPGTDPFWAFGGAFAFMLIVMVAGQAAKSR